MANFLYVTIADASKVGQIINLDEVVKVTASGDITNIQMSDLQSLPVQSSFEEIAKELGVKLPAAPKKKVTKPKPKPAAGTSPTSATVTSPNDVTVSSPNEVKPASPFNKKK
jgi:hypothetical protein